MGPEDSNGSNTFGGAINFVSLQPTLTPHFNFSRSAGSFGQSELWLNATGTHDAWATRSRSTISTKAGYTTQTVTVYTPAYRRRPARHVHAHGARFVGRVASRPWEPDVDVFAEREHHGARFSARRRSRSELVGQRHRLHSRRCRHDVRTVHRSRAPSRFCRTSAPIKCAASAPLGAGELTANIYESDNGITIDGNPSDPAYDVTHIDHRYNGALTWQRTFATSQFAIGGYTRYEVPRVSRARDDRRIDARRPRRRTTLGQTINVFYARGGFQPAAKLRLDGGVFESNYTSFGANLDGRFGRDLQHRSQDSASFLDRHRLPRAAADRALPVSASQIWRRINTASSSDRAIRTSNPSTRPNTSSAFRINSSPRRSTSRSIRRICAIRSRSTIRARLRFADACVSDKRPTTHVIPGCMSYNSNVGNAVYQGIEARFVQRFAPQHLFLTAMYGLNVAYPKDLNANFSNPTSGGNLVDNQQFPGIPQQQGSLELDWAQGRLACSDAGDLPRQQQRAQSRPVYLYRRIGRFQVECRDRRHVPGTNLFNDAAGHFTQFGAGAPYLGVGGIVAADRPSTSSNRLVYGSSLPRTCEESSD